MKRIIYTVCLYVCFVSAAFAQTVDTTFISNPDTSGLTPQANNNNNLTFIKKKTLPADLKEISGQVYWKGRLYGHIDSPGSSYSQQEKAKKIYVIDTASATIVQTIYLEGVVNVDWEDITQDYTHFYVCDVGNNISGNRQDLKIYKFPKSLVNDEQFITIPNSAIEVINFSYEDQTDFSPKPANKTEFDCEAVAYNRGKLHLFSKNWIGSICKHYTLPIEPGTYTAKLREQFSTGGIKITGADFGAYDMLVLVGYNTSNGNIALYLDYGFDGTYYYFNSGQIKKLNLGWAGNSGQVEGVSMKDIFRGYITNEYFKKVFFFTFEVKQTLAYFSIKEYIEEYYKNNPLDLYKHATPKEGTIRYNKNTHKMEGFDGTHWMPFH